MEKFHLLTLLCVNMIFKFKCKNPPFYFEDYEIEELGVDENFKYAEVTVDTCKKCGAKWLEYLIEEEHYTKSGRWWRTPIEGNYFNNLTALNAKEYLELSEWCFVGGPSMMVKSKNIKNQFM